MATPASNETLKDRSLSVARDAAACRAIGGGQGSHLSLIPRKKRHVGSLCIFRHTGWPTVPFSESRETRRDYSADTLFIRLFFFATAREQDIPARVPAYPVIRTILFRRIIFSAPSISSERFLRCCKNGQVNVSIDLGAEWLIGARRACYIIQPGTICCIKICRK